MAHVFLWTAIAYHLCYIFVYAVWYFVLTYYKGMWRKEDIFILSPCIFYYINTFTIFKGKIVFFYIIVFWLTALPQSSAKRSYLDIFVSNTIYCLIVGKFYSNPVFVCYSCFWQMLVLNIRWPRGGSSIGAREVGPHQSTWYIKVCKDDNEIKILLSSSIHHQDHYFPPILFQRLPMGTRHMGSIFPMLYNAKLSTDSSIAL